MNEVQLLREGARAPAVYAPDEMIVPSQFPIGAVVVDCAQLSEVLRQPLTGCGGSSVYRLTDSFQSGVVPEPATYEVLDRSGQRSSGAKVSLPADLPVLDLPNGLVQGIDGFQLYGEVLFTSLPGLSERPDSVLVATDGKAATVEGVRTALGSLRTPFPPLTAEEATVLARSATDGYARVAMTGLALVVLVGGLSLTVTTADSLRERRNAHAALAAMGTPVRVLRQTVLLQTATPLLLTVTVAVAVSAAASWMYLRLVASDGGTAPALPWTGYGLIAVSAIVASLLATASALPFVRSATHPDALRME